MQKNILILVLISFCFFSLSCEKSNPVGNQGKPTLKASESNVSVALNYYKGITVSGGQGRYFVKSMTDSNIVQTNFYQQSSGTGQISWYVEFYAKKLGSTKIIIQDSAKTAEVEIVVTVAIMVSSPSSISVKTQQTKSGYISGGTSPLKISQASNTAIATVTLSGSSITVTGVSQGTTSVTISDNSNPSNMVTIPITVIIPPTFSTTGKIAFVSTIGNFATEGIYGANNPSFMPSNDAGAGGFVTKFYTDGLIGQIIGYKMLTSTQFDIVVIFFLMNSLTPATISLDSGYSNNPRDIGIIAFAFNLSTNTTTEHLYSTYSGSLTFSTLNEQKAEGSFGGKAGMEGVMGSDVTISQGSFSVPLLVEEESMNLINKGDQKLFNQIEKMLQPQIDKMKEQIELQKKHRY